MKNLLGSTSFLVVSAIFLTGMGLLVTLGMMGTAMANKVTLDFDNVKQGAVGEYNSKEARELYNPNDPSGQNLGQDTANFAQNSEELSGVGIESQGKLMSFLATGICHTHGTQCQ